MGKNLGSAVIDLLEHERVELRAAAATVLLYLDLRVRSEGLDIELSARQLVDGTV